MFRFVLENDGYFYRDGDDPYYGDLQQATVFVCFLKDGTIKTEPSLPSYGKWKIKPVEIK